MIAVAGTKNGIIKWILKSSINFEIVQKALDQAKSGRDIFLAK